MMSRERKVEVSFRIGSQTLQHATADASRRGCTLERWAEEVFEAFAVAGYRAMLPPAIPPGLHGVPSTGDN